MVDAKHANDAGTGATLPDEQSSFASRNQGFGKTLVSDGKIALFNRR